MSQEKKPAEEGDRRAWQHAIDSGAFGSSLTEEEQRRIVLAQCYTAEAVDGQEATSEADLLALLKWASGVRVDNGLLDALISGHVFVRMKAGDAEPRFHLSPTGEARAKEVGRTLGLPVADDE